MVGGNDLFEKKCTDRFVMANVLNVAKRIFEDQPEAKIVIHGITPRKDLLVRKFIKVHSSRIYYMNLGQVLMTNRQIKGRQFLDENLIADGTNPTPKGMEKWGDLVKKKLLRLYMASIGRSIEISIKMIRRKKTQKMLVLKKEGVFNNI